MLTCEYLEALLGNGKEYFGLSSAVNATAPPVWAPINAIQQVVAELENVASANEAYAKVRHAKGNCNLQFID